MSPYVLHKRNVVHLTPDHILLGVKGEKIDKILNLNMTEVH